MNIQNLVNTTLAGQMTTLGGETITVDSTAIIAVPAEVDSDRELMGGSREQRDLTYQYPTISGQELRKGMQVQAQNKEWKIDTFQRGRAMTTLMLVEPNRVEE